MTGVSWTTEIHSCNVARPSITPEQESEIRKLRSQGFSERRIAAQTGLSKSTVHGRISALPIPTEPPPEAGYGERACLDRRAAEREARVGRAPGQPASSVLTPEEWEAHQRQLAEVDAWAASLYPGAGAVRGFEPMRGGTPRRLSTPRGRRLWLALRREDERRGCPR